MALPDFPKNATRPGHREPGHPFQPEAVTGVTTGRFLENQLLLWAMLNLTLSEQ